MQYSGYNTERDVRDVSENGRWKSPPAEANIHTDSDTLQSKLSEMTVNSERWMERFIMNPQVVCSDSLTSDDNPEDRSLDVDDGDDMFQDSIPTVVSVRPEVTESGWTGLSWTW